MRFMLNGVLLQEEPTNGETHTEEETHNPLIPETVELIAGTIAFFLVFFVLWKFAFPRIGAMLRERTAKIQGEMEKAEQTRQEADKILDDYRTQLANARDEANQVIEEARRTAEQLRKDIQERAEKDAEATVARAQEEIRAERDRVVQELRAQVGALSVQLAERVVGASLDAKRHQALIDEYIDQLASTGNGNGSTGAGS
jgi:F-type H+-transporting ATPase subunit b